MHKTKLVFLNCCKTADGLLYAVGLAGLTTAFLKAGVREVVAYIGPLQDNLDTCRFVDAFYKEYSQSFEADTALREAQIQMIKDGIKEDFWSRYTVSRQGPKQPSD